MQINSGAINTEVINEGPDQTEYPARVIAIFRQNVVTNATTEALTIVKFRQVVQQYSTVTTNNCIILRQHVQYNLTAKLISTFRQRVYDE